MEWVKEGVNYWENPGCPIEYLQGALVRLINDVEDVNLPIDYFNESDRNYLMQEIAFYEGVADK